MPLLLHSAHRRLTRLYLDVHRLYAMHSNGQALVISSEVVCSNHRRCNIVNVRDVKSKFWKAKKLKKNQW